MAVLLAGPALADDWGMWGNHDREPRRDLAREAEDFAQQAENDRIEMEREHQRRLDESNWQLNENFNRNRRGW